MVSYRSVFSPLKGNIFQMLLKLWIFPWFPRFAILVYNLLGVGIFRFVLMNTIGLVGKGSSRQTNYRIGERTMNNLLTFTTNQTMFNEGVHTIAGLPAFITLFVLLINGHGYQDIGTTILVATFINLYCVLLQRYNRAKLVLLIEQRLNEGDRPDYNYSNWLGLDFSELEEFEKPFHPAF